MADPTVDPTVSTATTVRERLIAAGLAPDRVDGHLAANRVVLPDGTRVAGDAVIPADVIPMIGYDPQ